MKTYEIEFARSAQKELGKLPPRIRNRVSRSIRKLSENPRSGDVRPMIGSKSWRLRIGDYRVVYDIYDQRLVVLIVRVKHRRDIYKR